MQDDAPEPRPDVLATCPICRKPSQTSYRPFCSRTCRDKDLLNWLDGSYAIPAVEIEDDDQDPPQRGDG